MVFSFVATGGESEIIGGGEVGKEVSVVVFGSGDGVGGVSRSIRSGCTGAGGGRTDGSITGVLSWLLVVSMRMFSLSSLCLLDSVLSLGGLLVGDM